MNKTALLVLLVATSCSNTVAKQKPRAWYGNYSPSPTCGWSDGYGSKWECDGPIVTPVPPRVYAVGETIDIGTAWTAFCRVKEGRTRPAWTVEECNAIEFEAVLVCDNPACRVGRAPDTGRLRATLTAAGSYPMRVRFVAEGKQGEVVLPTIEAVQPDEIIVACSTSGMTNKVQISVMHGHEILPSEPELVLDHGDTCTPAFSTIENAATFECQKAEPRAESIVGTVTTAAMTKQFSCRPM